MFSLRRSTLWFAAVLLSTSAYGESCEQLEKLSLPDTTIDSSSAGPGEFKDPAAPWLQPLALPPHCRVRGTIRPTADSDIRFEVWLPLEKWNGKLQGNGRRYMEVAPWLAIFPGLAISLAVLAFNLPGDALRDVLDLRMRGSVSGASVGRG